jgi:undecaprenol kinase/diacylglycerol kinase (ATP)
MNKISQLVKSFGYAIKGIAAVARSEQNFKIHIVSVLVVSVTGSILHISATEWVVICLCFGSVTSAELLNSAIEKLVDLVSPEYNVKAGLIKDIAAGAVLVLAVMSAIIGGIIFIPKLF